MQGWPIKEYIPTAQDVQLLLAMLEVVPERHGLHIDEPALEYIPAWQALQVEALVAE